MVTEKTFIVGARVVKTETGEVLLGEEVHGQVDRFFESLEQLSLNLARSLNSTLTETQIGAGTKTNSMAAMQSYSEGGNVAP